MECQDFWICLHNSSSFGRRLFPLFLLQRWQLGNYDGHSIIWSASLLNRSFINLDAWSGSSAVMTFPPLHRTLFINIIGFWLDDPNFLLNCFFLFFTLLNWMHVQIVVWQMQLLLFLLLELSIGTGLGLLATNMAIYLYLIAWLDISKFWSVFSQVISSLWLKNLFWASYHLIH